MEEKEMREFSWTNLFLVTGLCFLAFSGFLKLLDGSHVLLFLRIGLVTTGLGLIAFLNKWAGQKFFANDSPLSSRQQEPTL